MLAASTLLALLTFAAATPVPRGGSYPQGQCVTDVKIEPCYQFDCKLDGYHRIDAFLNQAEQTTQWNYVFYKTAQQISSDCVTDISVVPAGQAGPQGTDWFPSPHSALSGVTEDGGAQLFSRRNFADQYAGKVVDLVVVRPGRWANSSEEFIQQRVNLGLGEAAAKAEYPVYREYNSVSSGWVYLEYTKSGPRDPITDVKLVECGATTLSGDCGNELLTQGWKRRDVDLNGPTANGSHIYLFTSTNSTSAKDCVGGLRLVNAAGNNTLSVNVNAGTNGTALYLEVQRTKSTGEYSCLTSLVPIDTSKYFNLPGYKPVLDSSGAPADFNDGVPLADPIYLYWSQDTYRPKPTAPQLAFNTTGGFRIAHFSDLHFGNVAGTCLDIPEQFESSCSEEFSFTFMGRALDLLQPDLVIINGDLFASLERKVDGRSVPQLTRGAMQKAFFPIIERGLPFAVTWGNHDAEGTLLREELQLFTSYQPGYVGSRGVPELDGIGNYQVDILKRNGAAEVAHKLWFFDSRSYTYLGVNGSTSGAYGQVEDSQVNWYQSEASKNITTAMAFFHIPLGQISGELGLNSTAEYGVHGENVCAQGHSCTDTPDITKPVVGLLKAFTSVGDVKATFSGHDHSNDYVIKVNNISLTYDGSAGYNAYSTGDPNYNREMRCIDVMNWGSTATSFKVIDDIFAGTVHQNTTEAPVRLF